MSARRPGYELREAPHSTPHPLPRRRHSQNHAHMGGWNGRQEKLLANSVRTVWPQYDRRFVPPFHWVKPSTKAY